MTHEEWLQTQIDRYRRKIETYQAMIAEWETELGTVSRPASQQAQQDSTGTKKSTGTGDHLSRIAGMVFWGKSQPEAARAFLEMVGYPLTTEQIIEGIEKGGVKIGGKTPAAKKQNFYTILDRSSDFARVAKNTWGLIGWPGVTKKQAPEDREEKRPEANGATAAGE